MLINPGSGNPNEPITTKRFEILASVTLKPILLPGILSGTTWGFDASRLVCVIAVPVGRSAYALMWRGPDCVPLRTPSPSSLQPPPLVGLFPSSTLTI